MRIWIFLLFLTIMLPCNARDVYKWTSNDGVILYSDTYRPGAERVSVTTGKQLKTESLAADEPTDTKQQRAATSDYQTFEIAQPENDETIRSNEGVVKIGLSLAPRLASGHVIQVFLDGSKLTTDITTTQFSLNQLNRGTHTLQAKVVDAEGNLQISTQSISFHLRKASIKEP